MKVEIGRVIMVIKFKVKIGGKRGN
jgi:hypothetical protein